MKRTHEWLQRDNPSQMILLLRGLLANGFFVPYLTPSQYNVFERVLSNDIIFSAFWSGRLTLDIESDDDEEMNFKKGKGAVRSLMDIIRCLVWEGGVCDDWDDIIEQIELTNFQNSKIANENKIINGKVKQRDEDEDDDYDNEEDEKKEDEKVKANPLSENSKMDIDLKTDENGNLIYKITKSEMLAMPNYPEFPQLSVSDEAIGQNIHPILSTNIEDNSMEKRNELKLVRRFNKLYHSFESDIANIFKKRKLERSNRQLDEDEDIKEENEKPKARKLITFGGAANLTLKNLLNKIEDNRENLNITDMELKNLIMDVRKNRSKWSNYNKIGQEELYEACEKVVTELRGYTEHSTPFLNKVSKREAPNYYEIIKQPMDLNTVMKKLKSFQYINKQQFIDDLMLIWQNCLSYNSDPKHFLRKDAIAMRKKTQQLIPLIPDITIRDRAEVEKEAVEQAAKDKSQENAMSNEPEVQLKGRKSTRGVTGTVSRKGRAAAKEPDTPAPDAHEIKTEDSFSTPVPANQDSLIDTTIHTNTADETNNETLNQIPNEEEEENLNVQSIVDEEPDDLETAIWKNITSATRYRLCNERSKLFKDGKLEGDANAIIRDTNQMWNFQRYNSNDNSQIPLHRNRKYYDEHDDPYLLEYDVSGGIPEFKHQNINVDKLEDNLMEQLMGEGKTLQSLPDSGMKVADEGSNHLILENIKIMQDIRRVCFKINLIRQMQTNQFVHQSQFIAPDIQRIRLDDIDPMSKLPTRDQMSHKVCQTALLKSVSAIVMHTGFESTTSTCAMLLTHIAEEYMGNLAKTMKLHLESKSINKLPLTTDQINYLDILQIVLGENGIDKPDTLYTYYKETLLKKNQKLSDIKNGLENFLRDLLRPSVQELSETQFKDGSDQFVNGEFSDEIGDDFFGFKELGLDKEFGMLTSSIPLHLLQSKLSSNLSTAGKGEIRRNYPEFDEFSFPKMTKREICVMPLVMIPYLDDLSARSKINYTKLLKKHQQQLQEQALQIEQQKLNPQQSLPAVEVNDFTEIRTEEELTLMETSDLPLKQRNSRPRVPPNGKLQMPKKRNSAGAFFLDRQDELEGLVDSISDKIKSERITFQENKKVEPSGTMEVDVNSVEDDNEEEEFDGENDNDNVNLLNGEETDGNVVTDSIASTDVVTSQVGDDEDDDQEEDQDSMLF